MYKPIDGQIRWFKIAFDLVLALLCFGLTLDSIFFMAFPFRVESCCANHSMDLCVCIRNSKNRKFESENHDTSH